MFDDEEARRQLAEIDEAEAGAQHEWFDFQAARLDARAREWLAEEGCEPA
jgi:hypothetical protein